MNNWMLTAFIGYLLLVVGVALLAYRVTRNLSDFVLGGRSLGGPVAALSAGASDMSAWLLLALPGAVFSKGLNQLWITLGLSLGAYASWRLLARPLRVYTEMANDSLTVPAFLDNRFFDASKKVRVTAAFALLVFFAVYTASGLVGGATLLQNIFGLSYHEGLLVGSFMIVSYTFIGGFLAVSWTDFFQGTFMFITLLVVPCVAVQMLGGWSETLESIHTIQPELLNISRGVRWLDAVNLLAWGLGYFGQPHILVRYMAVRTLKDITIARRICISWMTLSLIGATLTGLVAVAYFEGTVITNPESVFIRFSYEIFPPVLAGMILAAILSSIMCALDSQMLASSSALTEDIYHPFIFPKAKPGHLMWVGRLATLIIAAIAFVLAYDPESRVLDLVGFAWAGLGASFGPVVIGSLFWSRMTATGAIWGMLLGAGTVVLSHACGGFFGLYEIIPGYLFSTLGVILGSLWDRKPNTKIMQQHVNVWQVLNKKER